ncbi:MAG: O-antigen polymerase [Clostridiaceae bacterium]
MFKELKDKLSNFNKSLHNIDDIIDTSFSNIITSLKNNLSSKFDRYNRRNLFFAASSLTIILAAIMIFLSNYFLNTAVPFVFFVSTVFIIFYLYTYESITQILNPITAYIGFYYFLCLVGLIFRADYAHVIVIQDSLAYLFIAAPVFIIIGVIIYNYFHKNNVEKVSEVKEPINDVSKYYKVSLIFWVIGILLSIYYFISVGGIPLLMEDADNARVILKQGRGYVFILIYTIFLSSNLLITAHLYTKKKLFISYIFTGISLVLILGIGYRGQALKILLAIFILISILNHGRLQIFKTVLLMFIALFGSGLVSIVRSGGELSSLYGIYLVNKWRFFVNLYNAQMVVNYLDGMKLWGKSIILDLQTLLPGYQPSFNIWLKEVLNLKFTGGGLTSTVVGELYFNFGYIITLLLMVALGYLLAFIKVKSLASKTFISNLIFLIILNLTFTSAISSSVFSALLFDILPSVIMLFIILNSKKVLDRLFSKN